VRKLADLRNVVALERGVIKSSMCSAMRSETGLQSCAEGGDHLQPCNSREHSLCVHRRSLIKDSSPVRYQVD